VRNCCVGKEGCSFGNIVGATIAGASNRWAGLLVGLSVVMWWSNCFQRNFLKE
jgi:hypothetical protein